MKLVIIESPFGKRVDGMPCTPDELERNLAFARAAMLDSLRRQEAPYGSHLLYPQVLNDATPEERRMGMEAGFAWGEAAAALGRVGIAAVYIDRGITPGMREGIERHKANGLPIEYRRLGGSWAE